jgi:predicted transcriptional regulator
MAAGVCTVRLTPEKPPQLAALAQALDRSRNWLVNAAIDQYLAVPAWQLEHIQKGLDEADRGALVPHEQVLAEAQATIHPVRTP